MSIKYELVFESTEDVTSDHLSQFHPDLSDYFTIILLGFQKNLFIIVNPLDT